jgi:hypothetical protein
MNDNVPTTPAENQADALFEVRDRLDTLSGKLESMAGLAGFAGMRYGENDHHLSGMFFSIQNLGEAFRAEACDLVQRLMELERGDDGGQP